MGGMIQIGEAPRKQEACGEKSPNGATCLLSKGHQGNHWGTMTEEWSNEKPEVLYRLIES